jgi:peptidoglycan/LPS O-acetylase OafA/YrhL
MSLTAKPELYRPDIDGLRALAVVPVILFHAQLGCPGGFVGVDVFFVISGYLISKIIMRDLELRRFSVLRFYQRRIRRIFPALFCMLLAVACLGLLIVPPAELKEIGKSVLAAAGFGSNIFFYRHAGYFDTSSLLQPLLHTWTLSVEEQFYIVWPLLLWALSSRWLARLRFSPVLLLLPASVVLSAYWVEHNPNAAFYLLPSRAWELALGASLSVYPHWLKRLPRPLAHGASLAGLAMLIYSIACYNGATPFPGYAALLPCVGSALLIGSGEAGPSLGGRILSWKPFVWIGLISYSLYLWHWPVLVFARLWFNHELTTPQNLACVVLIFTLSWASWRFVESPFRDTKRFAGSDRLWVMGGLATTAVFLAIGAALYFSGGFPQRAPELTRWVQAQEAEAHGKLVLSPCLVWKDALPPARGCTFGVGAEPGTVAPYSVVLWGDSNGAHLSPVLDELGRRLGVGIRQITKADCPPLPEIRFAPVNAMNADCAAFNRNVEREVLAGKNVRVVVLAARWIPLAEGLSATPLGARHPEKDASRALFVSTLRKTVETLQQSGRHVVVVAQVPGPGISPITCLARARINHQSEAVCNAMPAAQVSGANAEVECAIAEALQGMNSVGVVHPFDQLCSGESCRLVIDGRPLFWDERHLSADGARLIEPSLAAALAQALR